MGREKYDTTDYC